MDKDMEGQEFTVEENTLHGPCGFHILRAASRYFTVTLEYVGDYERDYAGRTFSHLDFSCRVVMKRNLHFLPGIAAGIVHVRPVVHFALTPDRFEGLAWELPVIAAQARALGALTEAYFPGMLRESDPGVYAPHPGEK